MTLDASCTVVRSALREHLHDSTLFLMAYDALPISSASITHTRFRAVAGEGALHITDTSSELVEPNC